jgi:hypothetical protein
MTATPTLLMVFFTCEAHVCVSRVVAVNRESTHRVIQGFIRTCVKAHRNDGGLSGAEDRIISDANRADDFGDVASAVLVEDFHAADEGFFCNTKVVTTDYGSDMCTIWKGEKEKRVSYRWAPTKGVERVAGH